MFLKKGGEIGLLVVTARQADGAADQYSSPFLSPFLFLAACLIQPPSTMALVLRNSRIWELNIFESLQFHFGSLSSSAITLWYCDILKPFKHQENLAIYVNLKTLKTIVISKLSFGLYNYKQCCTALQQWFVPFLTDRTACQDCLFFIAIRFPIFPLLHAWTFSRQLARRPFDHGHGLKRRTMLIKRPGF